MTGLIKATLLVALMLLGTSDVVANERARECLLDLKPNNPRVTLVSVTILTVRHLPTHMMVQYKAKMLFKGEFISRVGSVRCEK